MSFSRDKRLLLGLLAGLAPLPLPASEVLEWPWLVAYLLAVGWFLRRAWLDREVWMPVWAMNVLGLCYLPFAWLDLTVLRQGQVIRPLLHLALFVLAVKLFAFRRERDKWQILVVVYILFMAAMGTSVHPSIVVYLVMFVGLSLLVLVRFAAFHVLTAYGRTEGLAPKLPLSRFVVLATLAVLLGSVPLFAVLPRVRTPFIMGSGTGSGTLQASTGFTDELGLDETSRLRENDAVAVRLVFERQPAAGREVRLRAATYDLWNGRDWRRSPPGSESLPRLQSSAFSLVDEEILRRRLAEGDAPGGAAAGGVWAANQAGARRRLGVVPTNSAKLYLEPLRSTSLPLPDDALTVAVRVPNLFRDQGGAAVLQFPPAERLVYDVDLAERPVLDLVIPATAHTDAGALDLAGITPQVTALAGQQMVGATPLDRVKALERHLITGYSYTLDFVGRGGDQPIDDFLFRYKSGHCEYFASAMVLLLRSQGVPARIVTGFLGAEANRLEGYYLVRQGNAHAWVEAWIDGVGWQTFDPTPPDGRPNAERGGWQLLGQIGDWMVFRWDRYVLSYGFEDQVGLLRSLRQAWSSLWSDLFGKGGPRDLTSELAAAVVSDAAEVVSDEPRSIPWWVWVGILGAAAGLTWVAWRRRPVLTATWAYERLRRETQRAGTPIVPSTAPLEVAAAARARAPEVAGTVDQVVKLYLRESFGGTGLDEAERSALRSDLAAVVKAVRQRRAA